MILVPPEKTKAEKLPNCLCIDSYTDDKQDSRAICLPLKPKSGI